MLAKGISHVQHPNRRPGVDGVPAPEVGERAAEDTVLHSLPVVPLTRTARPTGTPWLTPSLSRLTSETVEIWDGVPTPYFLAEFAGWEATA